MSAIHILPTQHEPPINRPFIDGAWEEGRGARRPFERVAPSRRPAASVSPATTDQSLPAGVLDSFRFGLAAVDETGRIRFSNQCLRSLVRSRIGVGEGLDGRLFFTEAEAERKFRALLRAFFVEGNYRVAVWALGANRQADAHTVAIRPLGAEQGCTSALVIIAPRQFGLWQSGGRAFLESFKLTPAEHRLTEFLVSGGRLSDAASSFGVSRHTVGNQLRSVFGKTGVTRQTDLVRLVWSGGVLAGFV